MRLIRRAPAFIVCMIFSGCGFTATKRPEPGRPGDYAATIAYLKAFIAKDMKSLHAQGMSIALVEDQHVIWSEGFGTASDSPQAPATPATIYRIGSVTKLFTATALMRLREQDKVDLDAPVKSYLPNFTIKSLYPDAAPITVRQMLTHHSGLPRDHVKGSLVMRPEQGYAYYGTLPERVSDDYVMSPPNALFSYSNLGFAILGHVVAKTSGSAYADFVQDSLLAPMGMTHASVLYKPERDPWISRLRLGKKELGGADINISDQSAGAIYASAEDLARFMEMIFNGGVSGGNRILAKASLDSMFVQQNAGNLSDGDTRVGLGFFLQKIALGGVDSLEVFQHGGSVPGFTAYFLGSRSLKVGVVALMKNGDVTRIGNEAVSALLDAKLGRKLPKARPSQSRQTAMSHAGLDSLVGSYGMHLDAFAISHADIRRDGDHLEALIDGKRKVALIPSGHDTFLVRNRLFNLIPLPLRGNGLFIRPVADRKWVVGLAGGRPLGLAERITQDTVTSVWRARAGRYACLNQDANAFQGAAAPFELAYDPGTGLLFAKWNGTCPFPVRILSDQEAVSYGKTEGIHIAQAEGKEYLEFSGLRFARDLPNPPAHP